MAISKLDQLFDLVKTNGKKRLVAAYAVDDHTITAISKAVDLGIVEATLVGDTETIKSVCEKEGIDAGKFKIVQEKDDFKAAQMAVKLINADEGDFLMKGLVSTDKYMRAILNKESGLMPGPKATLTHIALLQNPFYHKLLVVSDIAIIPAPDLKQKTTICNYLISTARNIGIEKPKVAVLANSEKVDPKIPESVEAGKLKEMYVRGEIRNCIVEGPVALDIALVKAHAEVKHFESPVAGDADIILSPNIFTSNTLGKSLTEMAGAKMAGLIVGAKVPIILTSRGSSSEEKYNSIVLAAAVVAGSGEITSDQVADLTGLKFW